MIEKCKDCRFFQPNTVYLGNNLPNGYCHQRYSKISEENHICSFMKGLLTTEEYYAKQKGTKKKLFDCTLREISEFCSRYSNHCEDPNHPYVFCPLMERNNPFNECALSKLHSNPEKWKDYKEKEIILNVLQAD